MTESSIPDKSPRRSTPLLAILCLMPAITATLLGVFVRGDNVLAWDVNVTREIQRIDGPFVHALADIANLFGSTWFAAPVILGAILLAGLRRKWSTLVFLTSLLVLRLLATQLKPLFSSPRPPEDLVTIIGTWEGTGYPSGHALTSSTLALGLAIIAWSHIHSRARALACVALLIIAMLTVGWARIWTGAHWTSDVIGGYLYGMSIVAISLLITRQVTTRNLKTTPQGALT